MIFTLFFYELDKYNICSLMSFICVGRWILFNSDWARLTVFQFPVFMLNEAKLAVALHLTGRYRYLPKYETIDYHRFKIISWSWKRIPNDNNTTLRLLLPDKGHFFREIHTKGSFKLNNQCCSLCWDSLRILLHKSSGYNLVQDGFKAPIIHFFYRAT